MYLYIKPTISITNNNNHNKVPNYFTIFTLYRIILTILFEIEKKKD